MAGGKRGMKRKGSKKKASKPKRQRKSAGSKVLNVKRTVCLGQFAPGTLTTDGFYKKMTVSLQTGFTSNNGTSLGGLTNLTEFTALFDQYKLLAFKVVLRPQNRDYNLSQLNPSTGTTFYGFPYVSVMRDPFDVVAPSGTYGRTVYNSFLEQGGDKVKTYRGDKEIKIYCKSWVPDNYGNVGAPSVRWTRPKWTQLDANGQAMQHYGYTLFFHNQNFDATTFNAYDVFVTYYLKFRGSR